MNERQRRTVAQKCDDLIIHGASDFYVVAVRNGEGDIEDEFLAAHDACDWIERAEAEGGGPFRIEANGYARSGDDHTLYDGFGCPGCATCAGSAS